MSGRVETPLELASRHVAEAEQRRAQQFDLLAGLQGNAEVLAQARQVLAEIERTLAIARTHRSLLQSLEDGV